MGTMAYVGQEILQYLGMRKKEKLPLFSELTQEEGRRG